MRTVSIGQSTATSSSSYLTNRDWQSSSFERPHHLSQHSSSRHETIRNAVSAELHSLLVRRSTRTSRSAAKFWIERSGCRCLGLEDSQGTCEERERESGRRWTGGERGQWVVSLRWIFSDRFSRQTFSALWIEFLLKEVQGNGTAPTTTPPSVTPLSNPTSPGGTRFDLPELDLPPLSPLRLPPRRPSLLNMLSGGKTVSPGEKVSTLAEEREK